MLVTVWMLTKPKITRISTNQRRKSSDSKERELNFKIPSHSFAFPQTTITFFVLFWCFLPRFNINGWVLSVVATNMKDVTWAALKWKFSLFLSHNFKIADAPKSLEKNIIAYAILCHVNHLVCNLCQWTVPVVQITWCLLCQQTLPVCVVLLNMVVFKIMTVKSNHPIALV